VSAVAEEEAEDDAAVKEDAPVPTPVAQPAPTPLGSRTASTPAPASVRAGGLRHGDDEDAGAEAEEDTDAALAPVARSAPLLGLRDRTEDRGKAVEPAKPRPGTPSGVSPTHTAPVTSDEPDKDSRPDSSKDAGPKPAAPAAARPGIFGTARPAAAPGPFGKASVSVAADRSDDSEAESGDEAEQDLPSAQASATRAPIFGTRPAERPADSGNKPADKPTSPADRRADADEDDEIDEFDDLDEDIDDDEDEALNPRPEAGTSALKPSRFGAAPAAGVSTQDRPSPATGPANEPTPEPSKPAAGREESAPAPRLPAFGARPGASASAPKSGLSGPFPRASESKPVTSGSGQSAKQDGDAENTDEAPSPVNLKPPTPKPGLFGNRPPTPSAFAPAKPAPKPGTASQAPTGDSSKQPDNEDDDADDDDLRYEPLDDEAPDTPASASPAPANPAPASPARPGLFASLSAPLKTNPGPAADKPSPAALAPAPSAPVPPADPDPSPGRIARARDGWNVPQIRDVLEAGSQQIIQEETLRERARIIEETLEAFGAPGKVIVTNPGPVITQFGVEPGYLSGRQGKQTRVKVSAIAKLDADLALALSARSIRIEAPVPGRSYVGIEVPNAETALVGLRDIMESPAFDRDKYRLPIALGKSIDGAPMVADLTQMPHLLIAGTTGSGKSVCVNAIISCLLLEYAPSELQLIMVDPKRVELTGYNGIPHLVSPVVVDLERIVGVLKWVTREMEDRYKRFSAIGARNITDHNARIDGTGKRMPYLVVIVDELADLMMLAPDETEKVLTRLAQMARATGIHLIISTQRPSVDVVTGLIKANFPARISFAVASSVDSRVVLDQPGAEKLLGRGDMLYQAPDAAAPIRMQGVFVSDAEINRITRHWKEEAMNRRDARPAQQLSVSSFDAMERPAGRPSLGASQAPKPDPARLGSIAVSGSPSRSGERSFFDAIRPSAQAEDDVPAGDDDDLYREAADLFKSMGKVSISLLQRRLRIGVNRAARLIDLMKQRGVLGSVDTDDDDEDSDSAAAEA
jgi:DNA segregation ATPase FtsK/SpoIIIE-like protein